MRISHVHRYNESRDALARDWHAFLAFALPEAVWFPIPNIGADAPRLAETFSLDGIILSGGNDFGEYPERDTTEISLIDHSIDIHRPILGVCRGLQVLNRHFQGRIAQIPDRSHAGTRHELIMDEHWWQHKRQKKRTVNSFHDWGIPLDGLVDDMTAVAQSTDGMVECATHQDHSILGVMWHPERERPFREEDRMLVRKAMGLKE